MQLILHVGCWGCERFVSPPGTVSVGWSETSVLIVIPTLAS